MRLQESTTTDQFGKAASILDLFSQPKTDESKTKPTNTAELLSSDQASLAGIRTQLTKQNENEDAAKAKNADASDKKNADKGDTTAIASSRAQTAYLDNGPSGKTKNAA